MEYGMKNHEPDFETSLSYRPPKHSARMGTRVVGFLALLMAAFIVLGGNYLAEQSDPVRAAGQSATGTLYAFDADGNGGYKALVEFKDKDGVQHEAVSRQSFTQNVRMVDQKYEVYYMPGEPERTFIQGIDPTMDMLPFWIGGGVFGLLGVALMFRRTS